MKTKLFLMIFALASVAAAQSSNGYVFVAPGGVSCCGHTQSTVHAGGGGEAILWKGLGAGAEVGGMGPTQYLSESFGVFSANGYYHLLRGKHRKLDPFVTGGYTLFFREGAASLGNFGAGVNYWFSKHVGLRTEFRDHVYITDHYWGFRFGVAFR
ncbi:MAG: hypothetical protein ABI693_08665 [Bryobacteraceae bacterium]